MITKNLLQEIFVFLLSTVFISCNTYLISLESYAKNEMRHYDFSARDTILDVSTSNLFFDPFIATNYNHLHFYLAPSQSWSFKEKVIDEKFRTLSTKYKSSNRASFKIIRQIHTGIDLATASVDKILCRNKLYGFAKLDTVLSEFYRVLKSNGRLIVTQKEFDDQNVSLNQPLPKATMIIQYFEARNFKLVKQTVFVLNKRLGDEQLLVFAKK